jgi:hypothetical protein
VGHVEYTGAMSCAYKLSRKILGKEGDNFKDLGVEGRVKLERKVYKFWKGEVNWNDVIKFGNTIKDCRVPFKAVNKPILSS